MSGLVHGSAVVDAGAHLDPTATVDPFCVIGPGAVIGPDVRIRAHAVIDGDVRIEAGASIGEGVVIRGPARIGRGAALFPYVVVGQAGQFPGRSSAGGRVEIGPDATLREFVAVNQPVLQDATRIGRGCYLMARTQVDHDCTLEDFVKTATGVTLGGSVHVEEHAYLGMNAVVHQGLRIGRACMIGMNGVVTAHVPPFATLVRTRITRVNAIGLARIGANAVDIARIEARYRDLGHGSDAAGADDPWIAAIERFIADVAPAPVARIAFPA